MVIDGLRHRLMDPEMFRELAEAFTTECRRGEVEKERGKGGRQCELAAIRLKLDKLVDAVANGLKSTTIQSKLADLERQEEAPRQEIESV